MKPGPQWCQCAEYYLVAYLMWLSKHPEQATFLHGKDLIVNIVDNQGLDDIWTELRKGRHDRTCDDFGSFFATQFRRASTTMGLCYQSNVMFSFAAEQLRHAGIDLTILECQWDASQERLQNP
ncbi:hypothetical protein DACRYDRAFT_92463 [Dacryopinax primogenitus]|uniref:Uncharacterized protein n=1 Tax=Dacryopinax primogenitus (strain DJM 731) TaxID=1858805 RepID=M5G8C5_DACPD|nr:uncharacterized protein DACRYDRAFT_92463 [Dacryopinax primogenitus]EJU06466.1 hypothetical protein DACRYDRAFT_92463 [Dacryopinax primogenitus]